MTIQRRAQHRQQGAHPGASARPGRRAATGPDGAGWRRSPPPTPPAPAAGSARWDSGPTGAVAQPPGRTSRAPSSPQVSSSRMHRAGTEMTRGRRAQHRHVALRPRLQPRDSAWPMSGPDPAAPVDAPAERHRPALARPMITTSARSRAAGGGAVATSSAQTTQAATAREWPIQCQISASRSRAPRSIRRVRSGPHPRPAAAPAGTSATASRCCSTSRARTARSPAGRRSGWRHRRTRAGRGAARFAPGIAADADQHQPPQPARCRPRPPHPSRGSAAGGSRPARATPGPARRPPARAM